MGMNALIMLFLFIPILVVILLALISVFSKYILPLFTFQQVVRMYITKLGK